MRKVKYIAIIGATLAGVHGNGAICKKGVQDGWCDSAKDADCNIRSVAVCGGSFVDQMGDADTFEKKQVSPQWKCQDTGNPDDSCTTYIVKDECYKYTRWVCDLVPKSKCWRVITQEGKIVWYKIAHSGGQEETYYEVQPRRVQTSAEWKGDVVRVQN